MRFAIYEPATGEIVGSISMPRVPDAADLGGRQWIEVSEPPDRNLQYVGGSPAALLARPTMPCVLSAVSAPASGTDVITVSSIPSDTAADIRDANGDSHYVITDGLLEITSDHPARLTMRLSRFPFTDWSAAVQFT